MQSQLSFQPQQMAAQHIVCFHPQKEEMRRCVQPSCPPSGLDQTLPVYPTNYPNGAGHRYPETKQNLWGCDILFKNNQQKKKTFYYVNTNEIPSELSCESLISSHVKITIMLSSRVKISPLLRLPNKPHLSDQKTI